MRILRRTNLYTEQQSDEVRLQQLERRIFPDVAHWAVANIVGSQAVGGGGHIFTWDHFWTASPTVFSTSPDGGAANNEAGDDAIRVALPGIVLAYGAARFESGTFYRNLEINGSPNAIGNVADVPGADSRADASVDSQGQALAVVDEQWYAMDPSEHVPGWFTLQASVFGGVDKDATFVSLCLILFASNGGERELTWRIY